MRSPRLDNIGVLRKFQHGSRVVVFRGDFEAEMAFAGGRHALLPAGRHEYQGRWPLFPALANALPTPCTLSFAIDNPSRLAAVRRYLMARYGLPVVFEGIRR
jgi:hypothetical protein